MDDATQADKEFYEAPDEEESRPIELKVVIPISSLVAIFLAFQVFAVSASVAGYIVHTSWRWISAN